MMDCRGMGAVTRKGNKPKVMAKGKKVPSKMAMGKATPGYANLKARLDAMAANKEPPSKITTGVRTSPKAKPVPKVGMTKAQLAARNAPKTGGGLTAQPLSVRGPERTYQPPQAIMPDAPKTGGGLTAQPLSVRGPDQVRTYSAPQPVSMPAAPQARPSGLQLLRKGKKVKRKMKGKKVY